MVDGCPVPSLLFCWYTKPFYLMFPTPLCVLEPPICSFQFQFFQGHRCKEENRPWSQRLLESMAQYNFLEILTLMSDSNWEDLEEILLALGPLLVTSGLSTMWNMCRPVRLSFSAKLVSYLAMFFLSQQISEQHFQPWLISQANGTCDDVFLWVLAWLADDDVSTYTLVAPCAVSPFSLDRRIPLFNLHLVPVCHHRIKAPVLITTKGVFGFNVLKFNSHHINVSSNTWSTKCRLIACMSAQIMSNLRDESIKSN
jgi:hypothetical protein